MLNKVYRSLLFVFILFFIGNLFGQTEFFNEYNNVYSSGKNCVVQIGDSGYVIAGQYNNPSSGGYLNRTLTRLDKNGDILWEKVYNVNNYYESNAIKITSNNRIIVAGYYDYSKVSITHFDLGGNVLHYKIYNLSLSGASGNYFFDIKEGSDSSIYVLARNNIIKTDSLGNEVWIKQYNLSYTELTNIHCISSNKFILTGNASNIFGSNSYTDLIQICIDSNGVVQWSKAFGLDNQESETSKRTVMIDDKIISFAYNSNFGSFIMATDTTGNQLWCKGNYFGVNEFYPVVLNDKSIVSATVSNNKLNLFKFNVDGDLISKYVVQSPTPISQIHGMIPTFDNGLYMETNSTISNNRIGFKFNANLNSKCIDTFFSFDSLQNQFRLDEKDILFVPVYSYSSISYVVTSSFSNLSPITSVNCNSNCDVVSNFKANKVRICENSTINFTNLSENSSSYQWFINDGYISSSTDLNYQFNDTGSYKIMLISTNLSCFDTSYCQVEVEGLPAPSFNYDKNNLQVYFQPTPSKNLKMWDCADSSQIDIYRENFIHNYKSIGIYNVCLKESNSCGIREFCKTIFLQSDNRNEFVKYYNNSIMENQYASSVCTTSDGGYVFVGIDDSYGSSAWKGLMVKTNEVGTPIRTNIVNFPAYFQLQNVTEAYNGDLLVSGNTKDVPAKIYFGRIDSNGLSSEYISTASNTLSNMATPIELENGDLIYSSTWYSSGIMMKTDPLLKMKWYKRYTLFKNLKEVLKVDDGFVIVGNNSSNQLSILKTDFNGDVIWGNSYDLGGSSSAYDIIESNDHNFLVTGYAVLPSYARPIILKISTNGDVIWCNSYPPSTTPSFYGNTISQDNNANILVSRSYNSGGSDLLQTDSIGNVLWSSDLPDINGIKHVKTHDDGIIALGTNQYTGVDYRPALVKLALNQTPLCTSGNGQPNVVSISAIANSNVGLVYDTPPTFNSAVSNIIYSTTDTAICLSESYPIIADFNSNRSCSSPVIQFSDSSQGSIIEWNWTFENGNPSSSNVQNPTVLWSNPGTYEVVMTVMSLTDTLSVVKYIDVEENPIATFSSALDPLDSLNMIITNNSTGQNLNYLWDFGDGNYSSIAFPNHTYSSIGVYNVCLTVVDSITHCNSMFCDSTTTQKANGIKTILVVAPILTNINQDFNDEASLINLYPNPFHNFLSIEIENQKAEILITSIDGKRLYHSFVDEKVKIDTDFWGKGLYILNIIKDGVQNRYKLVKY